MQVTVKHTKIAYWLSFNLFLLRQGMKMEPDDLCQIFRYKMVSQEYGGEER